MAWELRMRFLVSLHSLYYLEDSAEATARYLEVEVQNEFEGQECSEHGRVLHRS